MNLFEEQIRERELADQEAFEESFFRIAGAVMGTKMTAAMENDWQLTLDALEKILRYYHVKAKEIPAGIKDRNEQLDLMIQNQGIMRRNVRLEDGWYKDAVGAMLGTFSDSGLPVALIPSPTGGYRFVDPQTQSYVRVNKFNQHRIDREAICFYRPLPLEKVGTKELMTFILQSFSGSDVLRLLFASVMAVLVGLIIPKLTNVLFGPVIEVGSVRLLGALGCFMIAVTISTLLVESVRTLLIARLQLKISVALEAAAMMRLLSLPTSFFKNYSSGDLNTRMFQLEIFSMEIMNVTISGLISTLFSLAYISQIINFAPSLAMPSFLVVLCTLVVIVISVILKEKWTVEGMSEATKESGISYAFITGIRKIKLSGAEKRAFARWGKQYAKSAHYQYDLPLFLKLNKVLVLAISLLGMIIIYGSAIAHHVSIADYFAFQASYGIMTSAVLTLAALIDSIALIRPTIHMIEPILESVPEVSEEKELVSEIRGGIELSHISFRYANDSPYLFEDLSLKIKPGDYVAIVGPTGCGKSTLLRLMLGFETPQKGEVFYDRKPIRNLDIRSLRRKIGVVLQNGKLFMGDIFANITVSAPWLTQDEAWEAADIAGIGDDIREMPMGMHTIVAEGGGSISGGQKQRLLLARAIAPKPKILMLDEATSALDNITQRKVSEAMDKMNCTRIIIAHRLSTIRQCDRILVLSGGKIAEDGTYDELIEKNGIFAELVSRQQIDEIK